MKHPAKFDLIAFDWDGTLYDSTAVIRLSIQDAVTDLGGARPPDDVASYVIGMNLQDALAFAAPDVPPSQWRLLAERYRHHYAQRQSSINLFEGVTEMLHALKSRRHLLAVATGKSRKGLNEVLGASELQGVFDGSRTADETAGKPHPLMLHELMAEFDVKSHRVLMVGDTTHDLEMARNAGCASVGVSYGAHAPEGFAALGPLGVFESVQSLHHWLSQNA